MRARRRTILLVALMGACGDVVLAPGPDATVDASEAGSPFADVVAFADVFETFDANIPDEGCEPFVTKTCDAGCPDGTVCARYLGGCPIPIGPNPITDLGCVPIPQACAGQASCACMGLCACNYDFCYDEDSSVFRQDSGILCQCTTTSRRAFKKDIEYVDHDRRVELAREISSASLVSRDDAYGRLSAILAAQDNQERIDALKANLGALPDAGR